MSTFYDNYVRLCALNNLSESGAAKKIGLSNAAASGWKKGKMPSATTQIKLADLFGVSVEELTQDIKKALTSTSESERSRQIAARISEIVCQLYPETQESCLQYFESLLALQNAAQGRDIQG